MPASMIQQNVLIRISFLKDEKSALERRADAVGDANELVLVQDEIKDKQSCIKENERWLRVLERDPGYGSLINVGGKYIPKMPTFKSKAEMEYALEHPDIIHEEDDDTDEQGFMATREMVHRYHNEQALIRMDGHGPKAYEEQCGLQNVES